MALLRAGSAEYRWSVDPREIARIWTGGCIIRARLLPTIMQAFGRDLSLPNLLLDGDIAAQLTKTEPGWRRAVETAVKLGIAVPALSASLAYFDSYHIAVLPPKTSCEWADTRSVNGKVRSTFNV